MVGTFFVWGNIQVYVCSYFRNFNPDLNTSHTFAVLPIQMSFYTIGMAIGAALLSKMHPK